jgi:hypothetical protein
VIGITIVKIVSGPERTSMSSFNRTLADVLHVCILRGSSQAADVIILIMTVAWKLADPGIDESGGRPSPIWTLHKAG